MFSSVLFTSCEDEPIDPAFTSKGVDNGGGNSGGGGNGVGSWVGVVKTFSINATKHGAIKQWTILQAIYF